MALVFLATKGYAESFGPRDVRALQQVIDRQIEAFHRGDAGAAYGHAVPGTEMLFSRANA